MTKTEDCKSGMFWHIHHDILAEWSDNIDERIDYINKEKPKDEIETRLRLLKPVQGELPTELVKAYKAWDKAYEARDKAYKTYKALNKAWGKAWDKAYEAYKALNKAKDKYKIQIEVLHAKECPNCPWNGSTIFS